MGAYEIEAGAEKDQTYPDWNSLAEAHEFAAWLCSVDSWATRARITMDRASRTFTVTISYRRPTE